MPDPSPYCFISYSRKDASIARWLQQRLEAYTYPADLVKENRRPSDPRRIRPVFLDTSDLSTSAGKAWDALAAKIDRSRYLLVLCSRNSAASRFVDDEIARFIGGDERRLENIIVAITDPAIDLNRPTEKDLPEQILQRWPYFSQRNNILLRPHEGEGEDEARARGFRQIVSFMLDVDGNRLYNRYLIQERKSLVRNVSIALAVLSVIILLLGNAYLKQRDLARAESARAESERARARTDSARVVFEQKIFPYSIVVGYVDNFLSPLLDTLDAMPDTPLMMIAMPRSYADLDQKMRVGQYKDAARAAGYAIEYKSIKTRMPRDADIGTWVPAPAALSADSITPYIDFASTVMAFKHVIDYKRKDSAYSKADPDKMVRGYADEFERSVLKRLKDDTEHAALAGHIVFIHTPAEALSIVNGSGAR